MKEITMTAEEDYSAENLIAHVRSKDEPCHNLKQHLSNTANLCAKFAGKMGLDKVGYLLGISHDLGKASETFQNRIRIKTGLEAHLEGKSPGHVDHSTAAAKFLVKKYGNTAGLILAYIVAGHHTGLPDGKGDSDSVLQRRLIKKVPNYSAILSWLENQISKEIEPNDLLPESYNSNYPIQIHLMIRMLYSALTDADFLDTESYMNPEKSSHRDVSLPQLKTIRNYFFEYLDKLKTKSQSDINKKRNQILQWCINAAKNETGIFSLTVPTGGGKTLSSMAFALEHANINNLRRIIYVIPYTSIIEQNAAVFRSIFKMLDENIILEHHSNFEPKEENPFNRLAPENWDAQIIVTTNVRFFESFYANKSSSCRRLHNIANSVIIFDEAQIIPRDYLNPCLLVINELTRHYGCSAVICTATQPSIHKSGYLKNGLENVKEIVPEPTALYEQFRRVRFERLPDSLTTIEMGHLLCKHDQVLCIVNTRKEARLIFESLSENTDLTTCFHLSTMMCPEHRSDILQRIREILKNGKACRLVSTQLVEAGVDIDFPVVYREIAGLDSIAQAAGRCNREHKNRYGLVYIFEGETQPPPGHLRQSAESGYFALKIHSSDPLTPDAIDTYFNNYYSKESHAFDKYSIIELCNRRADAIPFKEIAVKFKLIDQKQIPIIVPYGNEGVSIRDELKTCYNGFIPSVLRKKLHRLTVQLFERPFSKLRPVLEDVLGDGRYFVLTNPDIYDKHVGLKPDIPEFQQIESLIL